PEMPAIGMTATVSVTVMLQVLLKRQLTSGAAVFVINCGSAIAGPMRSPNAAVNAVAKTDLRAVRRRAPADMMQVPCEWARYVGVWRSSSLRGRAIDHPVNQRSYRASTQGSP